MSEDTPPMNQTIERYLQGRLPADEEQAFEEAYLSDRELLDDLILAEKLQQGFKELDTTNEATPQIRGGFWRDFAATPQFAAAASVLLVASALFSGLMYLENQSLREAAPGLAANASTRLVPLFTVRGEGDVEVAPPAADEWTVFVADPGFTPYDEYDAIITRSSGASSEQVLRLQGLMPAYDGQLAIGMPGQLLESGDYVVEINGRMDDWAAGRDSESAARFTFTVDGDR
jgi:hypothetical protein